MFTYSAICDVPTETLLVVNRWLVTHRPGAAPDPGTDLPPMSQQPRGHPHHSGARERRFLDCLSSQETRPQLSPVKFA